MPNNQNPLCIHEMMVHSIVKESDDVVTLNLIVQDFYPYHAGQYALVSINNDPTLTRAYSLSSTPTLSSFLNLTVRKIEGGIGSTWITEQVKVGDFVYLSDAQGEFNCQQIQAERYLLVAGGSGVTPIISMARWLLKYRPQAEITLIYSVHEPKDVIFKAEWETLKAQYPQLNLIINASVNATEGFIAGRLSTGLIQHFVPNIADYTVLTCGPNAYMEALKEIVTELGVPENRFFSEQFYVPTQNALTGENTQLRITNPVPQTFTVPVGMSLLEALEQNKQPIIAGCRTGICGSCKTLVIDGKGNIERTTNGPLTEAEIEQGYVLACSCQIKGEVAIDMLP